MLLTAAPPMAFAAPSEGAIVPASEFQVPIADFTGRIDNFNVSEWDGMPHQSVTAGGLTLRATASDTMLYIMVEGDNRDTRNVFYISVADQVGYNRIGRPDVNFLVANGHLYRPTVDQAANANPEWFGPFTVTGGAPTWGPVATGETADRIARVGMEHHEHWTGLRIRLDQIGNPDPADISISWQGFSTWANCPAASFASTTRADLPANPGTLMPVGSFSRPNVATYYPAEYFGLIPNPLVGGPGAGAAATPFSRTRHDYVTWRGLQPERGEIHLTGPYAARIFGWATDYPVHGADRDTWQANRPATLDSVLAAQANNGAHYSLRFVMDVPTGASGNAATGDDIRITQLDFDRMYPFGPSRNIAQINLSFINLMNRRVADIPDWAVAEMRRNSNRPYMANGEPATCPHNVPFMPDFDPGVPNAVMHIPGDNLYDRMRNPNDPYAIFWQGFRDQPFGEYENVIEHNGVRVTDGLFRCAIPNPNGGPDLRVCPNGCIPYRRPVGVRAADGVCVNETHYIQNHFGFNPDLNWGPEGMWYFSWPAISGGIGLAPRYEHHMLLYYIQEIWNMLAEAIAEPGSAWGSVAQIQIGLLGHWGEFHHWPTASAGTFPNAEIVYPFIRAAVDAFACNDNVQIGMRYANWIATKYGMGFFHDQGGQTAHFSVFNTIAGQNLNPDNFEPNGWGRGHNTGVISTTDNLNANMWNVPAMTGLNAQQYANAARNPTFWMTGGWSGGEWGDSSNNTWHRDVPLGNLNPEFNAIMNTISAFRWANVSNKTPRGPNVAQNPNNVDNQRIAKNAGALFDNMGYRYVVEEVNVDGILRRGETVDVSMVVANRGTAPFLRNWPFEVSFINAAGEAVQRTIIDDVDITTWLPRHRAINNARPEPTAYRYVESVVTGEPVRVYYRTFEELGELPVWPADHPNFIPAFDGRNHVEFSLAIPTALSAGEYTIAIAILNPVERVNIQGIRFHNLPIRADWRLPLTGLVVGVNEDARIWNATVAGEGAVTPRGSANPGEPVTITVEPRVGFALTAATVAGTGIDQAAVAVDAAAQTITFPMPAGAITAPLAVTVTPTWEPVPPRTWNAILAGGGSLVEITGTAVPGATVQLMLADRENINLTGVSLTGPGIAARDITANVAARTISFVMPAGEGALTVVVTPRWVFIPPGDFAVTLNPASTAVTNGGAVAITPAGAHPVGTPMTVTVTPPVWDRQIAPPSLSVTGVPGITLTATGATFPMPADGGTITVNAAFEPKDFRVPLQLLISHISELVIGGELRPEMFTEESWIELWPNGDSAHPQAYTRIWFNADRHAAAEDPTDDRETLTLRAAYLRLRAAYEGLVSITTMTLTPDAVTVNNGNLVVTSTVGGPVTGDITLDTSDLPAGVTATVNQETGIITVTGVRPGTDVPPITGTFEIKVTRGGVTETLEVTVNLTTTWEPDEYEMHLAYIFGNTQGYFLPGDGATRAHVATILARVKLLEFEHGIEVLPAGMEVFDAFADVNEGDWFYYYIAWAYDAGLVEGFGGYFRPDDYITREELAAIMVRTLDEYEETAGELPFDDAALISEWALHYVYTAFKEGLVIGDGSGNFNPLAYSIRAYVATIANRILGRVDSWEALEAAEVENKPHAFQFPDVSETAWYFPSILAAANDHRLTRDDDGAIDWKYIIRLATPE